MHVGDSLPKWPSGRNYIMPFIHSVFLWRPPVAGTELVKFVKSNISLMLDFNGKLSFPVDSLAKGHYI